MRLILPELGTCLLLVLLISACQVIEAPSTSVTIEPQNSSTSSFTVYFSDPQDPQARSYRGGPDKALAQAIDQARLSVDIAAHQLNLWSIRDALLAADRRGVKVRMVVESDYLDVQEIQQLKEAGIPVQGDQRESLMHHKFVILDRAEVWTGSMNFTTSDTYLNDNNLLRLHSTSLAESYAVEFNEMFEQNIFGEDSPANTPYPALTLDGLDLEVYFSPDDGTAEEISRFIHSARESIYFLAFSFTYDEFTFAILDKAREGVRIAGVLEASQISNIGSDYDLFRKSGLDVRLDGNPRNMHHKVMIIDGTTVITGSYNFSANAEKRNDENTIVIHDPQIAGLFMSEFERVYALATSDLLEGTAP